jgi:hypothetical protein
MSSVDVLCPLQFTLRMRRKRFVLSSITLNMGSDGVSENDTTAGNEVEPDDIEEWDDPDGVWDTEDDPEGSVAGGTDRAMPVEPEPINFESAIFVVLGVVLTLALFAQFVPT